MKKTIHALTLLLALFAAASVQAGATILTSLQTVTGTTNTISTSVGVFPIAGKTLYIQNAGLATTNALAVSFQLSLDGTNFGPMTTYIPTATNAVTDTFAIPVTNLTVYARVQVFTTNAVNVGVTLVQ